MKVRVFACVLVLVLTQTLSIQAAQPAVGPWLLVGPGVEYQLFELPGPNRAHVARMDRANPVVTLESSIAAGRISYGGEKVTEQARRVDGSLNFWDPEGGARSKVLVAINGSYVIPSTYAPLSGQVVSGWYAKRFDNLAGGSGFAWTLDRRAFIGNCINHAPEKQLLLFVSSSQTTPFQGINVQRGSDQLVVYTPHYNTTTQTDNSGVEVLIEMTRPNLIFPAPRYVSGFVRAIFDQKGSTPIPFDHIVLSASGSRRAELLANLQIGDEIGLSQEITPYQADCKTGSSDNWTKTYTSLSGGYYYLQAGQLNSFSDPGATTRHPRTAIAFNDQFIYFIVVDGRKNDISIGMTIPELAAFTLDYLGAPWAISEDGGGSSTMVINGEIVNQPSDPCYTIFLPLIMNGEGAKPGLAGPLENLAPAPKLVPTVCERRVGNAVMMVQVEPKQVSNKFIARDAVMVNTPTNLRLGPGTNYPILATMAGGTRGSIVKHFNNLDGVFAKGYNWWKVTFDGTTGWMIEDNLVRTTSPLLLWKYLR